MEPVIKFQVSFSKVAPVKSVCFITKLDEKDFDDDEASSDEEMISRSQQLLPAKSKALQELSNYYLATCHTNGEAFLWDLSSQRIIHKFDNTSPGLAMARVQKNRLAYQTRDGLVAIYDVSSRNVVHRLQTGSLSFCAMAVSRSDDSILVIPESDRSYCRILDLNHASVDDANSAHEVILHASGGDKKHGMLMSLAICDSIVACGMEDGTLFFHEWCNASKSHCFVKLSSEFILGLDLAASLGGSMVAIVGMAGNAEDLEDRPENEKGTVAVVKCLTNPLRAHLRSRIGTCSLTGGGKPGVDVSRFRPDGRLFAVGGWDKRVRLMNRKDANPLALLKGHSNSVAALDWATNSLLATGDKDGVINIWNIDI